MNVKIESKGITFKITEEEMNVLHAKGIFEEKLLLGATPFKIRIKAGAVSSSLELNTDFCLTLSIMQEELQGLKDMGRSREGLSMCVNGTDVHLQVDVRADTRARAGA